MHQKTKKSLSQAAYPRLVLSGLCREVHFDGAVGPAVGKEIVDVVSRVLAGEKVIELSNLKRNQTFDLPRAKSNPIVSIVPVNFGCLGSLLILLRCFCPRTPAKL